MTEMNDLLVSSLASLLTDMESRLMHQMNEITSNMESRLNNKLDQLSTKVQNVSDNFDKFRGEANERRCKTAQWR
jgi:hypothetical protein